MFGIGFSELLLIAMVALVVVGPQKLPAMLLSLGRGLAKVRRMTADVRAQTGIDEILREEGIDGVRELRAMLRGEVAASRARSADMRDDAVELDESQEYPPEGADAGGALPDDLVEQGRLSADADAPAKPPSIDEANAAPVSEADTTTADAAASESTSTSTETAAAVTLPQATGTETALGTDASGEPRKDGDA